MFNRAKGMVENLLRKGGVIAIPSLLVLLLIGCQKAPTPYVFSLPPGFPAPVIPAENPMSEEKVALGRALFYDKSLSFNEKSSCASCHIQSLAFAEPLETSIGATGEVIRRNSPGLINIAYNKNLTWAHPGLTQIEQQLLIPLFSESPIEMGITGHDEAVLERFNEPQYNAMFEAAYGDNEASFDRIVKALASFVRSLTSFDSPFDDYAYREQDNAISDSAKRGMALFFSERLECHHCHGGFNFTQSSTHERQRLNRKPFHNTGLYNTDGKGSYPDIDTGLHEFTEQQKDMGRFRAPTLRNIDVTAPYMHDGSLATLDDVIDFYARGGLETESGDGAKSPLKSPFVKGFELTEEERQDLKAFLASLTDAQFLQDPRHSDPWTKAQ